MTNMKLSAEVIHLLLKTGVKEFCICAGARNSPLIETFYKNPFIKIYHFFEERSAAFFALGRIASTRRPVAVVTTSGTAVAEILPAAVEATYSSLPLIIISADRPKSYRGTGSPQTIEQVGLFSYYIEACFDLDKENTHFSLKGLSWRKPVHVNICFSEPLIDQEPIELHAPLMEERIKFPETFPLNMVGEIQKFCSEQRPIVILSTLPEKSKPSVITFLKLLKAPIYAEGISGIKNHPELKDLMIVSGEMMVNYLLDNKICTAVLRIGGVPTCRTWRDLEDKRKDLPVLSIGFNHFTGLSREITHYNDIDDLSRVYIDPININPSEYQNRDCKNRGELLRLFQKYPKSEPSMIHALSKLMKDKRVYLGNSLPVRMWDLAADENVIPKNIVGNRGANGIDGQLSTFLGWSQESEGNWAIVGDLTALYDLPSLWIANQLNVKDINIVVINNRGGMIFKRIFNKNIFLNRHEIKFKSWAEMWGWDYENWTEIQQSVTAGTRRIIEVNPEEEQTDLFWDEWDRYVES
jgi:2-succinyl-5-enolpyruvyl-6-hydroxy-3-cyclohexene-1-carboxylate synthase